MSKLKLCGQKAPKNQQTDLKTSRSVESIQSPGYNFSESDCESENIMSENNSMDADYLPTDASFSSPTDDLLVLDSSTGKAHIPFKYMVLTISMNQVYI